MFVSICAYFGKVSQLGRGFRAGGSTYCCQNHAFLNTREFKPSDFRSPSYGLKRKAGKSGGGHGYWMLEDGGYWLDEDGGKWMMEDYT